MGSDYYSRVRTIMLGFGRFALNHEGFALNHEGFVALKHERFLLWFRVVGQFRV